MNESGYTWMLVQNSQQLSILLKKPLHHQDVILEPDQKQVATRETDDTATTVRMDLTFLLFEGEYANKFTLVQVLPKLAVDPLLSNNSFAKVPVFITQFENYREVS